MNHFTNYNTCRDGIDISLFACRDLWLAQCEFDNCVHTECMPQTAELGGTDSISIFTAQMQQHAGKIPKHLRQCADWHKQAATYFCNINGAPANWDTIGDIGYHNAALRAPFEIVGTWGYHQRDYADVVVLKKVQTCPGELRRIFWDAPLTARLTIGEKAIDLHEVLADNYADNAPCNFADLANLYIGSGKLTAEEKQALAAFSSSRSLTDSIIDFS